jgi:tetratricopeptide (TPR) repeat protein
MTETIVIRDKAPVMRGRRSCIVAMMTLVLWGLGSVSLAGFDEQRQSMRATMTTQPESAVVALIKAGIDEGKSVLAITEAQNWLRQNQAKDAMTLYHAARAAEYSGDLKGAVALYQQYLQQADLTTPESDEAVFAVYVLLVERLMDTAGAYAFSKNQGDRLLVCPRAKQFDEWFLDQAIQRNDSLSVVNRLKACIDAGYPQDLLLARYDNYFRWLLERERNSSGYRRDAKMSKALFDAYKSLIPAMTFSDELALQLDWAVSVKYYHQRYLDDDVMAPPIAEAKALLAKYPHYADWVMLGWGGGTKDNHPNHVGDFKGFWKHEQDAKMDVVFDALSRLPADEQPAKFSAIVNSWREWGQMKLEEIKAVKGYRMANLAILAKPGISPLSKGWHQYSPEEAEAIAAQIEENRHPDASMVRAIAAAGKDIDKIVAALKGPEAWRLSSGNFDGSRTGDTLWYYCGRPGGNEKRDAVKKDLDVFAKTLTYKVIGADAPADKRIAEFKKLWGDYRSPRPKIPGVFDALRYTLRVTPEALPALLKNGNADVHRLVRSVVGEDGKGMIFTDPVWKDMYGRNRVPTGHYDPAMISLSNQHRGMSNFKRQVPKQAQSHPLEAAFRGAVIEGVKKKDLPSWLVITWVNTQWPEDNDQQVKVAEAIFKSSMWKDLSFEAQFSMREWFKVAAMTPEQAAWIDAGDAQLVCKDLLALPKDADAATTAAALSDVIEGVNKSPVRMRVQGLDKLADVSYEVFADPSVVDRVLDIVDGLRFSFSAGERNERPPFPQRVFEYLDKNRDPVLVQRTAGFLWSYASTEARGDLCRNKLTPLTRSLLEDAPAAASVLARSGVDFLSRSRGAYGFNPKEYIPALQALAGKAAMTLGLVTIPVERNDPAYPIYKSQADWLTGNEDSAWALLNVSKEDGDNWDQLLLTHRKMSVEYLMWVLQRTLYSRDDARMESLIKALIAWAGEDGAPWTKSQKLDLDIAYGDVAYQLGQLENAHKIYVRTQQNDAYADMIERHKATLRRVKVERTAKRFEDALSTLQALDMERIPELWADSRYARAEVYYDMEQYDDAADDIKAILNRDPDHGEAKIMQGKVQLKRQKLMEASELDVGSKNAKNTLVPGDDLKVTLEDPTLAVSGAGTEIEVAVWATSGDKEQFFLRQFGDEKTKFRGEVKTALGAPNPGDRVLQVIGDDEIYYGYSERFRKKMNNMDDKRGGPITVRSDAILMASARKLLTEEEQRVADMEAKMAAMHHHSDRSSDAVKAARVQVAVAREAGNKALGVVQKERRGQQPPATLANKEALARELLRSRVKPGAPINVRVIDPDRSRTPEIDEVSISIQSSSGDSIGRVVLKETGTHTGWFEGKIPTAGAQAMAFAQNSEPGRNPNMVISPKTGYPAWRPVAQSGNTPAFKIDLNDNVPLGNMTVTANEPGAKLKKFMLQTGMNPDDMTTVGMFPKDDLILDKPWHPSVTIMTDAADLQANNRRSVYDLNGIRHHLERGWMTEQHQQAVADNVVGPSAAMTNAIPDRVKWLRYGRHHNAHVIYRFQGYFYEERDTTRRFKVDLGKWEPPNVHPSVADPAQYMLTVDGRRISEKLEKPPKAGAAFSMEGGLNLRKGVHRFEIWATGWDCRIGWNREVKVFANLEGGSASAAGGDANQVNMVACPDSFFDPEAFPKGVLAHRNGKAKIAAVDGGTAFKISFAPGSRARMLNLVFVDQEGPVPAVNRIELAGADGHTVLPVPYDYAELNKNDTLEILTGDQVTVRYVDDRFVTKAKEKLERFLDVSFSDGNVSFVHHNPGGGGYGKPPLYEPLLRFAYGKGMTLKISDPDMDMTDKPDTVNVVLTADDGSSKTVVARETEVSSAIFHATVVPVSGTPQSDTEVQVGKGGTLSATYRDAENVEPGVPTDRYTSIEHAFYREPVLRLSHATARPLDYETFDPNAEDRRLHPPQPRGLQIGFASADELLAVAKAEAARASQGLLAEKAKVERAAGGMILPRWSLTYEWANPDAPPEGGIQAVFGREMAFEIEAPHLALRTTSRVDLYLQTSTAREQGDLLGGSLDGAEGAPAFDVSIPGTIKVSAALAGPNAIGGFAAWSAAPLVPIYVGSGYNGLPWLATSDETGGQAYWVSSTKIFSCRVPLIADFMPEDGVLSDDEVARRREKRIPTPKMDVLVVRPSDTIYAGLKYKDESGVEHWLTGEAKVISHPVLDVMDEDYRSEKKTAYVGEPVNLRVVDLSGDVSDESDTISVIMQAKSGAKHEVELLEVDNHSGVFRGSYELSYAQQNGGGTEDVPYDVRRQGFPVVYGDIMGVGYKDGTGQKADSKLLRIMKGADGLIRPFSKKYDNPDIAMKTQFSLAEAFLEMAKRHRKLGMTELAEDEYARAKDMLEKAMDMFRDPATRAQAEYLLGSLTQEEADVSEDEEQREARYRAALSRFMRVTGSYPDTLPASKAQFKIATVYEKLDEPEIAAQEYVKLAYKYPDSEFLALAMARLGTHFQRKAAAYEEKAKALLEKVDDKDAQFDGKAMEAMFKREYVKSAEIFSRLQERFPDHELAGKGGLRAGQAYMRADMNREALRAFKSVFEHEAYDGPNVRASAMYWAGLCYEALREDMAAYSIYKRLTYDFPESKWASYARSQLSSDKLLNLEVSLEEKRIEEGR